MLVYNHIAFSLTMTSAVCALLLVAVFFSQATAVEVNEAVLEEGANGTAVVLLSVAYIQQAAIFSDDNQILRRIAYVETRDGTDSDEGGIWAVSEIAFNSTKETCNVLLAPKQEQILQQFSIVWQNVQLNDLRRPLYSALAARLVLFTVPLAIPVDVAGQAQFWRENYNTDGSVDEFIRATRELQGDLIDNSATDFYVGFARNYQNDVGLHLFVTTREPDPVSFTVDTLLGFNFTGVATHDSTTIVSLDKTFVVSSDDERNKGIHVSAGDKQIIIFGLNYLPFSSDAFLALPCTPLAVDFYEYYAVSHYVSDSYPSQLLFVSCEDNTTINFYSTTITLNKMETYLYETDSVITGTRVVANKPISFFSGSQFARVPELRGGRDHLTEQIPPTATWGTTFLSASFSSRMSGEIYRILTSQPSTTVSVNCTTYTQPETYSLATAGAWQEFMTPENSFCVIESNKPLLVVEFTLGNELDATGDPFMMMIPPIEQYSNDYIFSVPANFSTNFITIFVTPEYFAPDKIFVDNISQEQNDWTTIYCLDRTICGYAAHVSLIKGDHRLYHTDIQARIGVSAYGFASFNSYGYPGGLQEVPIQLAAVSFLHEIYSAGENEKAVNISVVRSGNTSLHAVVLIASHPNKGLATAGQDYCTVTEILEFSPGVTEMDVEIRIIDDRFNENNESFVLYLSSGSGVVLFPFAQVEVTIVDNDGIAVLCETPTPTVSSSTRSCDCNCSSTAIIASAVSVAAVIVALSAVVHMTIFGVQWKSKQRQKAETYTDTIYEEPDQTLTVGTSPVPAPVTDRTGVVVQGNEAYNMHVTTTQ